MLRGVTFFLPQGRTGLLTSFALAFPLTIISCQGDQSALTVLPHVSLMQGRVLSGQHSLRGASMQLYAGATEGASMGTYALLSTPIIADTPSAFSVGDLVVCPSRRVLIHLIARGEAAADDPNSPSTLMSLLGTCDKVSSTQVLVDDKSTVASVMALYSLAKSETSDAITRGANKSSKLVFLDSPENTTADALLLPTIRVGMSDSNGLSSGINLVASTSSPDAIWSAFARNFSSASISDAASFQDVEGGKAGTGYVFTAASPDLPLATSQASSVTAINASMADRFWIHPGDAKSPFNLPLPATEHLKLPPPGFSDLEINLSSWFGPAKASSPALWQAFTSDPKVKVLFNLQSWLKVAQGAWKRISNPPSVENSILATSSTTYPLPSSLFGLSSKYYYMTTSERGTGWYPPVSPALNPQPAPSSAGPRIYAPKKAVPALDSDGYFAIFQPDGSVFECYSGIVLSKGTIICGTYSITYSWSDLKGSQGGVMASMVPVYAGLIRQADIDSGTIAHALNVCLSPTQLTAIFKSPAISFDRASGYSGTLPMGTRLVLPRAMDLKTHTFSSRIGAMIAQAAQNYGAFVLDRGGPNGFTIRAEQQMTDPVFTHGFDPNMQKDLDWILGHLQISED